MIPACQNILLASVGRWVSRFFSVGDDTRVKIFDEPRSAAVSSLSSSSRGLNYNPAGGVIALKKIRIDQSGPASSPCLWGSGFFGRDWFEGKMVAAAKEREEKWEPAQQREEGYKPVLPRLSR